MLPPATGAPPTHRKTHLTGASMDRIFQLRDSDRANFLLRLLNSFGCSYICLWLHVSPQNYLQSIYGYYQEKPTVQQASSSSGTLSSRLFDQYRQQPVSVVENDAVPGLAFKRRRSFIVLRDFDLQRLRSSEVQGQFYLEARIKTAVFMGCRSGEIELGMPTLPQINMEMELRKLFPEDFQSIDLPLLQLSPSSPMSTDSPEYPSFLYNITTMREAPFMISQLNPTTASMNTSSPPQLLTQQAFPTPESVDAAIASAILATLSSPISGPLPGPGQETDNAPGLNRIKRRGGDPSAFGKYSATQMVPRSQVVRVGFRRQNMMKKVISFYHGLNLSRLQRHHAVQQLGRVSRPTSTQLHHVLSERKRREKINESFHALRLLLPPGTKKDKATVLRTTKEYMSSLKDQISELSQRNQLLESQLSSLKTKTYTDDPDTSSTSSTASNERFWVQLAPVMESSSEERTMDLQVTMQGDGSSMLNLVIRLLGFLKGVREVRLASMDAQTIAASSSAHEQQQHSTNRVTLRLIIEGSDWDQSAFLEAVKRVVADLAHWTR